MIIKRSEILNELEVCPYCMTPVGTIFSYFSGCCGETHHETAYDIKDYSHYVLESEVTEIIEDEGEISNENN